MLPKEAQQKLARRYGGASLMKEAFDQNLAKAFAEGFEDEREEHAVVMMVDITSFSSLVSGWGAEKIRTFLDDYYRQVMPLLFEHHGVIDRVAGDGILSVFSPFFTLAADEKMERQALRAAERIVKSVAGTLHSSKAALSAGTLAFCKTGLAGIYEEHTVIGQTITNTYRLEEHAEDNQVVVEATPGFSSIIEGQLARAAAERRAATRPAGLVWHVDRTTMDLRGVGSTNVYVERLVT
jgi:class 3 adenylate cyclase